MAKNCPNCGVMNDDQSKFCTGCGSNIADLAKSVGRTKTNQSFQGASGNSGRATKNSCLWCHMNAGFKEEEGKLDSKWGVTAHRVKIFICNNCGYSHMFGLGRTIWDFD